jgi:hypothetical protein
MRSLIWVVLRVSVPEGNRLAVTLEKVRAGIVPIPAEQLIPRITAHALAMGLDLHWEKHGEHSVALVKFSPSLKRRDIVLDRVQLLNGQIRIGGRSQAIEGKIASPTLPTRRVLQSTFPKQKTQSSLPSSGERETRLRSATMPII